MQITNDPLKMGWDIIGIYGWDILGIYLGYTWDIIGMKLGCVRDTLGAKVFHGCWQWGHSWGVCWSIGHQTASKNGIDWHPMCPSSVRAGGWVRACECVRAHARVCVCVRARVCECVGV